MPFNLFKRKSKAAQQPTAPATSTTTTTSNSYNKPAASQQQQQQQQHTMATTHKAWELTSYGGPETLKLNEIAIPTPGASQALVKTSYVAMNPFDFKIREGYVKDFLPLQLPSVIGMDVIGTIAKPAAQGTGHFKVGDRVMTMSHKLGAFQEHVALDESTLAKIPAGLDDARAATLPVPVLSAWTVLNTAGTLTSGSKVLVNGASGTVGAFAIQFAKKAGAYVVGVASAKNRDYVLSLGADQFIDYETQKYEEHVKDFDLVVDLGRAGADTRTRLFSVLKHGGAVVSLTDASFKYKPGPEGLKGYFPDVKPNPQILEQAAQDLLAGRLQSKIAQKFTRGQLPDAMQVNKRGGYTGRLVVDFQSA